MACSSPPASRSLDIVYGGIGADVERGSGGADAVGTNPRGDLLIRTSPWTNIC